MALELAKHNPVYEDIASKFFEVGTLVTNLWCLSKPCTRSILSSSPMP
jgi:hypothetical protein